jgi:hypothetical protein
MGWKSHWKKIIQGVGPNPLKPADHGKISESIAKEQVKVKSNGRSDNQDSSVGIAMG